MPVTNRLHPDYQRTPLERVYDERLALVLAARKRVDDLASQLVEAIDLECVLQHDLRRDLGLAVDAYRAACVNLGDVL